MDEKASIKPTLSMWVSPKLTCSIVFQAYDCSHQYTDDEVKKWRVSGPDKFWVSIEQIYCFRDVTEKDLDDNVATDSYFPTDYCIMEYWSTVESRKQIAFIAGRLKDVKKTFDKIAKKYLESEKKFHEISRKFQKEIEEEFKPIMDEFNSIKKINA